MNVAQGRAARIGGGVLAGGIIAGALLAMLVPTSLRTSGQTWREMVGIKEPAVETTPVLAYEAPPEDLTPVSWQTARQEYPSAAVQDTGYQSAALYSDLPELSDDTGDTDMSEPLPAALLDSRDDARASAPALASDSAGNAAQAARDAASDVRSAENAAIEPATGDAAPATGGTAPEATKVAALAPR